MSRKSKGQIIYEYLIGKIRDNELLPNEAIESENELARKFDVSRMTVRKEIDTLVERGYLYREHGRGTFVSEQSDGNNSFLSMTEIASSKGKEISNNVISYYKELPNSKVQSNLGVSKNQEILYIERLRVIDDEPYALEKSAFVASVFGDFNESVLSGSIYSYLEKEKNLVIVLSRQSIESIFADDELARLLEIKKGSPILKMTTISILKNGKAFEYTETFYRFDRYKIELVSYR